MPPTSAGVAHLETKDDAKWLRVNAKSPVIGVDRANRRINGVVLAQAGVFKDKRGEFDEDCLKEAVKLANAKPTGLKSRFAHPSLSDDGIGKYLGRTRNYRMDKVRVERDGVTKTVPCVRGDLHFDPTASKTPNGDLAEYVMSLAESDQSALMMSFVITPEELYRIDKKGKRLTDEEGEDLPPLWIPKKLHAVDVVDEGAATDTFLFSADQMTRALSGGITPELQKALRFDNAVRLGSQLLDGMFPKMGEKEIRERCSAWLERYLSNRFEKDPVVTPRLDERRLRLDKMALRARELAI